MKQLITALIWGMVLATVTRAGERTKTDDNHLPHCAKDILAGVDSRFACHASDICICSNTIAITEIYVLSRAACWESNFFRSIRYFEAVCSNAGVDLGHFNLKPIELIIPSSDVQTVIPTTAKDLGFRGPDDDVRIVNRMASTIAPSPLPVINATSDGWASDEKKTATPIVVGAIISIVFGSFILGSLFFYLYGKFEFIFDKSCAVLRPRGNSILLGEMPKTGARDRMEIAARAELVGEVATRDFAVFDTISAVGYADPFANPDDKTAVAGEKISSESCSSSEKSLTMPAFEEKTLPNKFAATVEDSLSP